MYYYLLIITTALLLSTIAYQDYRSRSVGWIFFPLLALAGITLSCLSLHSIRDTLINAAVNAGFLALQLLLLKTWFYIRGHRSNLINEKLGLGDILFLAAAAFFFSPMNFILFYTCSLLFTVLACLVRKALHRNNAAWTIPLAGLQSIFFLLFLAGSSLFHYTLTDDAWLLYKWGVV
jgi:hypothetical protein